MKHSPEEMARVVERSGMKWVDMPDTLRDQADPRMQVTRTKGAS